MSKLYEKLTKFRNVISTEKNYDYAKKVLNQLLVIGFNNQNTPDELPNVFYIVDVHYTTEQLEHLFKMIGYESEVDMITRDWSKGIASFKVTIA